MDNAEYLRRLEFAFVDFLLHASDDLQGNDFEKLIPILERCAEKNFAASFLLSLYWDPNGVVFKNRVCTPSVEKSNFYSNNALHLASIERVEVVRARNIIEAINS